MVKEKNQVIRIFYIFLIIILISNFVHAEDSFDAKKPDSWVTNIEKFSETLNTNPTAINDVWKGLSQEQKKYYSSEIINQISKNSYQIKSQTIIGAVSSFLSGKSLSEGFVPIENLIGLENTKISWNKNNVVTDGKVSLALERIPNGIIEVKYENNQFVLKYKQGGELILGEGATNEKGEIIGLQKMIDSGFIKFNTKAAGQLIKITNGELVASNGAVIEIGENKLTKISGITNTNLKWNKNILGNGKAYLDFENLPNGITEINYQETKVGENNVGEFILTNKDGRTISIRGGTDEQGKLIASIGEEKISIKDLNFIFDPLETRGNILISEKIDSEGKTIGHDIEFGLGTKLGYKGKTFSEVGGPMHLEIINENRFKLTRGEVTSKDAIIGTYSTSIETEVIFGEGDYSKLERYVQLDDKNKILNAVGNDLSVNLNNDFNEIHGKGDNIDILNGKFKIRFNDDRTYYSRIGASEAEFKIPKIVNENDKYNLHSVTDFPKPSEEKSATLPKPEKPATPAPKPIVEAKPLAARVSEKSGETRVCVGICVKKDKVAGDTSKVSMYLNPEQLRELQVGLTEQQLYQAVNAIEFDKTFRLDIILKQVPSIAKLKFGTEEAKAAGGPITSGLIAKNIKEEADIALKAGLLTSQDKGTFDSLIDTIVKQAGFNYYPQDSNLEIRLRGGSVVAVIQTYDYNSNNPEWQTKEIPITDPTYVKVLQKFITPPQGSNSDSSYPKEWSESYLIYLESQKKK